jgi:hypothetical protein
MTPTTRAIAFISAIALAASLSACTAPDRALRVLQDAGYSDITIAGYAWAACSEDDTFATRFSATGPSGRPASGAVCSGLFKGATIRLD